MLLISGYPVVFGNKDRDNEIVVKGAFSPWLAANPDTSVKLYWMHSHKFNPLAPPIGVTTQIKQDSYGVYVEAKILDTASGLEFQELVKHGAVRGASFGYKINDRVQKDGVWHLTDLDLLEFSIASWGANDKAFFEVAPEHEEIIDAE